MLPHIIKSNIQDFEDLISLNPDPYDLGKEIMRCYLIAVERINPGSAKDVIMEIERVDDELYEIFVKKLLKIVSEYSGASENDILNGNRETGKAIPRHIFRVVFFEITGKKKHECSDIIKNTFDLDQPGMFNRSMFYSSEKSLEGILISEKKWRNIYELIKRDAEKYWYVVERED